jgi:hypothetical protein
MRPKTNHPDHPGSGPSLPHSDHEGRSDEDADLAELDLLGLLAVPRGPQDDQPDIPLIQVSFRPQMESPRVFHRQLMQPERVPYLTELRRRRLKQAQPYETALAAAVRRILQRYRACGCTSRRSAVDA